MTTSHLDRRAFALVAACAGLALAAPTAATAPAPTTAPAAAAPAPAVPPNSDVFVATLDLAAGKVGAPRNLTNLPGYENQPAFLPDGSALLFVQELPGEKTDVWRHDFASGRTTRVTQTPEAEYSPTPLADGSGFSAVRVEAPDARGEAFTESQRLYFYEHDGRPRGPVHPGWTRVGYHAWLDDGHLALYIVGGGPDALPSTLVYATVADGALMPLARQVGASIARAPDGRATYLDQSVPEWRVATLQPGDARPTTVVAAPRRPGEAEGERARDLCWLPDGTLLMPQGAALLRFDPRRPEAGWVRFAEFPELGGELRRPTASRDGKRLAFVVDRKPPRTRGIRG